MGFGGYAGDSAGDWQDPAGPQGDADDFSADAEDFTAEGLDAGFDQADFDTAGSDARSSDEGEPDGEELAAEGYDQESYAEITAEELDEGQFAGAGIGDVAGASPGYGEVARGHGGGGASGGEVVQGPGGGGASGGEVLAGPARLRPSTGEPRVDAALARLDDLAGRPVTEHRAIFEDVHRQLRDVLGELDSRQQPQSRDATDAASRPGR